MTSSWGETDTPTPGWLVTLLLLLCAVAVVMAAHVGMDRQCSRLDGQQRAQTCGAR